MFAATEGGNVYAIGRPGNVLWQNSIGTVSANGNCGTYGVSSTGVVDTRARPAVRRRRLRRCSTLCG